MICHNCQQEIPNNTKFCPYCGWAATTPQESSPVLCPNCHTALTDEAKFCPQCGSDTRGSSDVYHLNRAESPISETSDPNSVIHFFSGLVYAGISLVCALIALALGLMCLVPVVGLLQLPGTLLFSFVGMIVSIGGVSEGNKLKKKGGSNVPLILSNIAQICNCVIVWISLLAIGISILGFMILAGIVFPLIIPLFF